MERLRVNLDEDSYYIDIDSGLLDDVADIILDKLQTENLALLSDENVWDLYGKRILCSLQNAGLEPLVMIVEPGENSKSLSQARDLYSDMSKNGIDRSSGFIAFGGGVVGDLGGFVASTYMRGIPYLQIPTTLLAQVDSSVGGKTAVNLSAGKNLVGSFYQPSYVMIDPSVLNTLSVKDLRSGLGEIMKGGLIRSRQLFERASDFSFRSLESDYLISLIRESLEIKARVVSKDQKDRGIRQILNFGHTIGHGLEAASGFRDLRHGEAVLWGLIGELRISEQRGYLSSEKVEGIIEKILAKKIPPLPKGTKLSSLLGFIRRDKKARDGKQNCVLLEEIGERASIAEVSESEIIYCLNYINSLNGGNAIDFDS